MNTCEIEFEVPQGCTRFDCGCNIDYNGEGTDICDHMKKTIKETLIEFMVNPGNDRINHLSEPDNYETD